MRPPGAGPVLLHAPHAGRTIPAWTRPRLLLDDRALAAELAALTDHRTDELARSAAARARCAPTVLANDVSRFVVDPERLPDGREEMLAVGMGAVYTHGTRGQRIRADDPAHRGELLAAFFDPWARAVADAVDAALAEHGRAVLLDVHSYPSAPLPYELHAGGPRPQVCLGTDPVHTPDALVAASRTAFARWDVALDSPFCGAYVPLRHLGRDPRVTAIMVELRRDTHLVEPDGPATEGFDELATALARLCDAIA